MIDIKNAILGATDREYRSVDVTIKGTVHKVWMCTPTGRERDAFEASLIKEVKKGKKKTREQCLDDVRAKLVACCMCKADGDPSRVFTSADVEKLTQVNIKLLDVLFECASEVSGMREADLDELSKV